MKRTEDDLTSKRRILDSAAKIFAERGYDGARVDEIAKRASVNKALIYYYFPRGKEELLEVLFQETLEAAMVIFDDKEMGSFTFGDEGLVKGLINRYLDVLEERQDILRVMLMESLKRSPVNDLIFKLIRDITVKIFATVETADGGAIKDKEFSMVLEFFTGIMPTLTYVVYHEAWMERFGWTEAELRERFITAFIGTHMRYSADAYVDPLPMDAIIKNALDK